MTKKIFTIKDTEKIASLANLILTKTEVSKFTEQLSNILDYVEKLKEINTDNVVETSQVTGLMNVTREDSVNDKRSITRNDYFKANAVFE